MAMTAPQQRRRIARFGGPEGIDVAAHAPDRCPAT
jgi:hypothetical protein